MGKFIIKRTADGILYHLKAANGEAIGTSEIYPSEESLRVGIETIKKEAALAGIEDHTFKRFKEIPYPKFEIERDKEKKFCFYLKGKDGQKLLTSQSYTAKASCKNGIQSVIKNAPDAPVFKELHSSYL